MKFHVLRFFGTVASNCKYSLTYAVSAVFRNKEKVRDLQQMYRESAAYKQAEVDRVARQLEFMEQQIDIHALQATKLEEQLSSSERYIKTRTLEIDHRVSYVSRRREVIRDSYKKRVEELKEEMKIALGDLDYSVRVLENDKARALKSYELHKCTLDEYESEIERRKHAYFKLEQDLTSLNDELHTLENKIATFT